MWGDGDAEAWQLQRLLADPWWQPFLRSKAPFVVLEPKNNIYPGFWAAQSALYGAYLSGVTTTLGAWDEAWYWTSAGFHQLNYGMFELARGYKEGGMSAYATLQDAEFASEVDGYTATRHQREVGTGYFDLVSNAITGGQSSTTALAESTEADQFVEAAE